jgi:ribonuclease VapC
MIVDTSALVAILRGEENSRVFVQAINNSDETVRLSAASYLEAAMVLDSDADPVISRRLDEFIKESRIVIEAVSPRQALLARAAWRDYGRGSGSPARLNFGDCLAYALAREFSEAILYKGNDFSQTDLRSALP